MEEICKRRKKQNKKIIKSLEEKKKREEKGIIRTSAAGLAERWDLACAHIHRKDALHITDKLCLERQERKNLTEELETSTQSSAIFSDSLSMTG